MPGFAAIIGHSDETAMLEECIRHHLSVGVDHVFVSLNGPESVLPDAFANDARVRGMRVSDFAGTDPFRYFSDAAAEAVAWAAPDWILFADSDEFWMPQGGHIHDIVGLDETDVFIVERFNTPVLRDADGVARAPHLAEAYLLPVVSAREWVDDAYLSGDAELPWIMARDAPKLLARASMVEQVGTGGHSIVATDPALRWRFPDDLLIMHAPFTTVERFRGKVHAIRATMAGHGDRFNARQAWHWRHWLSLDDGALADEFRRQSFRASAVPALTRQGVLAPVTDVHGLLRAEAEALAGDALQEALTRAIENYVRPGAGAYEPAAAAARAPVADRPWTYAPERRVARADDCYFYHTAEIPGHGKVVGQWDLRGRESVYLGGVDLRGKSVLEVGTASGYMGFWMERQGATVTCFDLDEHQSWDLVAFADQDMAAMIETRRKVMRKINNAWWFTRERLGAKARVIYGNVYGLDAVKPTFDVVTVSSVLLHLRDPFHALTKIAARSHDTIVVADLSSRHMLAGQEKTLDPFCMHFMPRVENKGPADTWWFVPERLTEEFLRILGFRHVTVTFHTQRFEPDEEWHYYTAVGRR